MKMVYLFNHFKVLENEHIGIRKKMQMQMQAFYELGFEPIYIVTDESRVVIEDYAKKTSQIFYFSSVKPLYNFVIEQIKQIQPKFVYMRYRIIYNSILFDFYNRLKAVSDHVVCEFYTFPYDTEFDENNLDIRCDALFSERLKECFHHSTNYNCYEEIYGIPSEPIINGINIDTLPLASYQDHRDFNMIGVALMFPWHGYDRIIEGMADYYAKGKGNRRVVFHLIGEGEESNKYKEIVRKHGIEDYVIFHGRINDKQILDSMFENMDVAIGSVGMHRLNLERVSPIKSAEYCARGIPFVINYQDISFYDEYPYILSVERDENAISIDTILEFVSNLDRNKAKYEMREYAEKTLTWKSQMEKTLRHFNIIEG